MSTSPDQSPFDFDDDAWETAAAGTPTTSAALPALFSDKAGMSDAELAIKRERDRRNAIEIVDRERAPKMPLLLPRVHIKDVVAQAVTELEVRREHGLSGFKTGIKSFDDVAAPLFQPGRFGVVAASTKTGKTTLLQQFGTAFAAQGLPVLIFTFEDEEADTAYRSIANLSSGDVGAIRAGFVRDGVKLDIPESFDTAAEQLASYNIEVVSTPGTCVQLAYTTADWRKSWPEGAHGGVVIVDQLSHIIPDDPATFRAHFPDYKQPPPAHDTTKLLEWQAKMLQRIARKWGVLVLLAHQLNENAKEHEDPTERSLRDSRGIGHTVDFLIIPHRPSRLPNPNPGPGQPETVENVDQRMWLCVPIARQVGGKFKVEVEWQGAHQRIADLGSGLGAKWEHPGEVTPQQLAGMSAINYVKERWAQHLEETAAAVNAGQAAPAAPVKLKAIGKLGAKWSLPVSDSYHVSGDRPNSVEARTTAPTGGFGGFAGFGGGKNAVNPENSPFDE